MKWYTTQLRAAVEQIGERRLTVLGVEAVVRLDPHPRQLAPSTGDVVVAAGELLLGGEQLEPGARATRRGTVAVLGHRVSSCRDVVGRPAVAAGGDEREPAEVVVPAAGVVGDGVVGQAAVDEPHPGLVALGVQA